MTHRPFRRAMTLIELMLALSVTAMVSLAIATMMTAMSAGVATKRDCREVMVQAYASETRLSSYVSPARCVLAVDGGDAAVWFDDSHPSNTVNATEVRWLVYDSGADTLSVKFVKFPDAWSQALKDLTDAAYPLTTDWWALLRAYELAGYVKTLPLIEELDAVAVTLDNLTPADAKLVAYDLTFSYESKVNVVHAASALLNHSRPSS